MELTTTASALHEVLATARHATPNNPSMVAYSGVMLTSTASSNMLSATGSDGETTITASTKVSKAKSGTALIPPKPILNYLSTLPPDAVLEVAASETALEITAAGSLPYKFRTLPNTFPLPPGTREEPTPVDLSRLSLALDAISCSVPKDSPGVQLISSGSGLTLHSTDNFRLTRAVVAEAGFGEFTGLLPLPVLERIARAEVTGIVLDAKGRTVRVVGENVQITTRLLSTPFPQVDALLSATPPNSVSVPTAPIRAALRRLESVAEAAPLKVSVSNGELTLTVSNADLGSGLERVELDAGSDGSIEFAVKLAYLSEAFNSHAAASVQMMWTNTVQPVVLRSASPIAVTSLVMPIRL